MMVVLQNLLFPCEVCQENEMFFRDGVFDGKQVICKKDTIVSFDTYFNSFAYKKWKKHTRLNEVCLKLFISGTCNVYVCYLKYGIQNEIIRTTIPGAFYEKRYSNPEEINLRLGEIDENSLIYFSIKATEDEARLTGGYYYSDDKYSLNEINLAVAICTYKREQYIKRNISKLTTEIIENPNSPLFEKMEIYISDNGETLDDFSNNKIHIYKNLNLGGSGGFTRCLIEIKKASQEKKHTHVIMMDDDIDFLSETITRTFVFLQLLKDECSNAVIGGQMLMANSRAIQFENAGRYGKDGLLILRNKNKDMTDCRNLLNNLANYLVNYNAWCYCCIPLSVVSYDNLPLPLFIHMDDIEYSLRNKFNVITINGICVWHPYYSNQRAESIVYYDVRNKLIVMSEMDTADIRKYALKWINSFHHYMYSYNYNRVILACRAVIDFCRGFEKFKNIDPITLNKSLMEYNTPSFSYDGEFVHDNEATSLHPYSSKIKFFLNYILPTKINEVEFRENIIDAYPFRVRKIVAIDRQMNRKTVYKRDLGKMVYAEILYRYTKHVINTKIYDSAREWRSSLDDLKNISFWNKYLKLSNVNDKT